MILYCFISHNSAVVKDYFRIQNNMTNINNIHFKVFYGGSKLNINNNYVIHLECNDTYEGLQNKIHQICKYLMINQYYDLYSHIFKIDGNNIVNKLIPLFNDDYYGYVLDKNFISPYKRKYHFGKCSKNSQWNNKPYDGQFVDYCAGGFGYVLSYRSVEIISKNPDTNMDIYEDLYVGKILSKYEIYPTHFNTIPFIALSKK